MLGEHCIAKPDGTTKVNLPWVILIVAGSLAWMETSSFKIKSVGSLDAQCGWIWNLLVSIANLASSGAHMDCLWCSTLHRLHESGHLLASAADTGVLQRQHPVHVMLIIHAACCSTWR